MASRFAEAVLKRLRKLGRKAGDVEKQLQDRFMAQLKGE